MLVDNIEIEDINPIPPIEDKDQKVINSASHVYGSLLAFELGLHSGQTLTKGEFMPRPRRSQVSVELLV
ncbi:hypothetical protein [Shewanella sp. SR44-3]|uniref:hypothetical protein n=1 Tax=Shewanella sp. SR44-3 TaxID=2760936 RepID=UPI002175B104|nr:hypothetical protein [Shewanella sp. SR44-3]